MRARARARVGVCMCLCASLFQSGVFTSDFFRPDLPVPAQRRQRSRLWPLQAGQTRRMLVPEMSMTPRDVQTSQRTVPKPLQVRHSSSSDGRRPWGGK